jgi:arginine/lysine/ornithine decarboxylase
MNDDRPKPPPTTGPEGAHQERVRAAFDDLGAKLGDRVSPEARATVESLRAAALEKDAVSVRGHLDDLKQRHGWLWEELSAHPRVAAIVNELALMGL